MGDLGKRLDRLSAKYKKQIFKIVAILIILVVAAAMNLNQSRNNEISLEDSETESIQTEEEEAASADYYVDISGAVHNPGVYKISNTTRLYELVEKAGGLTDDADKDSINQASYLEDGMKIIIPRKGENNGGISDENSSVAGTSSNKVNINTANKDELMSLPGIGEVIAERIIEYRSSSMFSDIEDLKNVSGIGNATFEKLKDQITI